MAPFGDAVGLVDDEERDAPACECGPEGAGGEALGRGEHELRDAALDVAQRLLVVAVGHA